MTERRPLVIIDGELQEIPTGDTINNTIAPGTGGLFDNLTATTDPGVSNDTTESYVVGSMWINVTDDKSFICLDNSTGAAVWTEVTASVSAPSMTQTELTGTTHTVDNTDLAGSVVRRLNNAAAITVTVAPSLTGTEPCTFIQTGAGQVTFAEGTGVTIHSADGNLSIAAQYGSASLIPDADTADTFYLVGHLTT